MVDDQKKPVATNPLDVSRVVQATSLANDSSGEGEPLTFGRYGETWLDRRSAEGLRSILTDRQRWSSHVVKSKLARLELALIRRPDVRAFLSEMLTKSRKGLPPGVHEPLAEQTIKNTMNVLRMCFQAALDDELILSNPARDVKVPNIRKASSKDKWTVLSLVEQQALLQAVPVPHRWVVGFAMGSGLRQGEQWALHLDDVFLEDDDPYVVIRYGGGGKKLASGERVCKPTKSGKTRIVPLFGLSLLSIAQWVTNGAMHKAIKYNPWKLGFPSRYGFHQPKKAPRLWHTWLRAAGIKRNVRWHDLRHTCASSLVGGWWGRKWSLEEVCKLLGHSKLEVTERYAHFGRDILRDAARLSDGRPTIDQLAQAAHEERFELGEEPEEDDDDDDEGGGGGEGSGGSGDGDNSRVDTESVSRIKIEVSDEQRCGRGSNPRMPVLQPGVRRSRGPGVRKVAGLGDRRDFWRDVFAGLVSRK